MFDAYTVKKLLPRLVIAVILIQLSWFLFTTMTKLTADIAHGIEGIFYAPFGGYERLSFQNILASMNGGNGIFAGGLLATLPAAFVGASFLGGIGVLSLIGSVFIVLLIAFILLVARRIILMALILISPIALVAWILPGTDKYWKLWWESFSKLLLVYPLIVLLIAAGRVLAFVAASSKQAGATGSPVGDATDVAIVTICYFGAFALVPKTFQVAGSAFANLTGMVNDRGRGPLDRLRNFRSGQVTKNAHKMKVGERWNSKRGLGQALNKRTEGLYTFANSQGKWGYLFNKNQREAARAEQLALNRAEYSKRDRTIASQFNDDMLQAQTYFNEADARAGLARDFGMSGQRLEKAIAAAKANGGWSAQRADYSARQLFATGTGYKNSKQAAQTIARVTRGNKSQAASIYGEGNSTTERAGRLDMKAGFENWQRMVNEAIDNNGAISDDTYYKAQLGALQGNDINAIMRGKTPAVKNLAPVAAQELRRAQEILARDPTNIEAQNQAGKMAGIIEKFGSETMYVSSNNIEAAQHGAVLPTSGQIETIYDSQANQWVQAAPPPTGNRSEVYATTTERIRDEQGNEVLNPRYRRVTDQAKQAHGARMQRPEDLEAIRRQEPPEAA